MAERNWKREYERALKQPVALAPPPGPGATETRRAPRILPAGLTAWIGHSPGLHLIDIGDDALEFYADRHFEPGWPLAVQVDTAAPIATEVLSCQLEETDPGLLEVRYRVRCRILRDSPT